MRAFWYQSKNFGDLLTPYILEHFTGEKVFMAKNTEQGKFLVCGSIMTALRKNDTVWGAGCIREVPIKPPPGVKFLAVRGPGTRKMLHNAPPPIYGDPGILLPLIYNPDIKKTHHIGILPHYIDKPFWEGREFIEGTKFIDIEKGWKHVVNEIKSCEMILTSSLHGIIASEAYGVPVCWEHYSDKIIGGVFKFQDYFLGTGRKKQAFGQLPPHPDVAGQQQKLINALKQHYGKN